MKMADYVLSLGSTGERQPLCDTDISQFQNLHPTSTPTSQEAQSRGCLPSALCRWRPGTQRNPYNTLGGSVWTGRGLEGRLWTHFAAREPSVTATKANSATGQKQDSGSVEPRRFPGTVSACPGCYFSQFAWRVCLKEHTNENQLLL